MLISLYKLPFVGVAYKVEYFLIRQFERKVSRRR